jgi:hypothetical protein
MLVVAALVGAGMAFVPSAQASAAGPGALPAVASEHVTSELKLTIQPGSDSLSTSIGGAQVKIVRAAGSSPDTAVQCTAFASNVTYFTGNTSGEQGFGEVNCPVVVAEIFVESGLYENGSLVNYNYAYAYNTIQAETLVTAPPSTGWYQMGTVGEAWQPAGTVGWETPAEVYGGQYYLQ